MNEQSSEVGVVRTLVSSIERTGALGAWMAVALRALLTATGIWLCIWLCFFASGAKETLEAGGGMQPGETAHHILPMMLSSSAVEVSIVALGASTLIGPLRRARSLANASVG